MKNHYLLVGLSLAMVSLSVSAGRDNPIVDNAFELRGLQTADSPQLENVNMIVYQHPEIARLHQGLPSGVKFSERNRPAIARESEASLTCVGETSFDKLRYNIFSDGNSKQAYLVGWVDSYDYYPEINIPDFVSFNGEDVPVTKITGWAFYYGYGITGVKIGKNIKVIEFEAFSDCSITNLIIPENVTEIKRGAFANNPITEITFENPSSLNNKLIIGEDAFRGANIETFEVPARLRLSGDDSFYAKYTSFLSNNPNLKQITINPAFHDISRGYRLEIIDNALCHISYREEYGIFAYAVMAYPAACGASDFKLKADLIHVFSYAFSMSQLDEVSLIATSDIREDKVNLAIESNAFYSSNISKLSVDANGPVNLWNDFTVNCRNLQTYNFSDNITNCKVFDNVIYWKNKDRERILFSYPGGKRDASFTLPEDCIHIDAFGMAYNSYLQSVYLPSGLKSIGAQAFFNDTNLEKIEINGEGILNIGIFAIMNTSVVDKAPEGEVMIGSTVVGYSGKMPENYVMSSKIKAAMPLAYRFQSNVKSVTFPEDFEHIPQGLYNSCPDLAEIHLSKNLKTIGMDAFAYSGSGSEEPLFDFTSKPVKPLILPDGLETIEFYAFSNSYNLFDSLEIPSSVEKVGAYAFNTANCISRVSINRLTPPDTDRYINYPSIFNDVTLSNGILVIPEGAEESDYKNSVGWSWDFVNIEHSDFSRVNTVKCNDSDIIKGNGSLRSADGSEFEVLRMDGTSMGIRSEFHFLPRGIYIIRIGNAASKISI